MTITNDSPPGMLSPISDKLFTLAEQAAHFANDFTEVLSFEDYATLSEIEIKLLAFGNLLEARDRQAFLDRETREAEEQLTWFRQRIAAFLD